MTSGRQLATTLLAPAEVRQLEMPETTTLCPICGWTGQESELENGGDERQCPVCDQVMKRR